MSALFFNIDFRKKSFTSPCLVMDDLRIDFNESKNVFIFVKFITYV